MCVIVKKNDILKVEYVIHLKFDFFFFYFAEHIIWKSDLQRGLCRTQHTGPTGQLSTQVINVITYPGHDNKYFVCSPCPRVTMFR